ELFKRGEPGFVVGRKHRRESVRTCRVLRRRDCRHETLTELIPLKHSLLTQGDCQGKDFPLPWSLEHQFPTPARQRGRADPFCDLRMRVTRHNVLTCDLNARRQSSCRALQAALTLVRSYARSPRDAPATPYSESRRCCPTRGPRPIPGGRGQTLAAPRADRSP